MFFLLVDDRRRSNSFKLSNLHTSEDGQKKSKHVVIKTETSTSFYTDGTTSKSSQNQELKNTPQAGARPASLHLIKTDTKHVRYTRNRSKSIDYNTQKKAKNEKTLTIEKLHKLKEKLLNSSPELTENVSDNESTPLVSEMSSPSASAKTSSSASSSFPLSPLSQKSTSPDGKQVKVKSEQNLKEATESHSFLYPFFCKPSEHKIVTLSPDEVRTRYRTVSDSASNCSTSPLSCEGNADSHSPGSHTSLHLYRQDALDSQEVLTDVYCDPELKN